MSTDQLITVDAQQSAVLLYRVALGSHGFNERDRAIEGISRRMLTRTLRAPEDEAMLGRTPDPATGRVVYALTSRGQSLREHWQRSDGGRWSIRFVDSSSCQRQVRHRHHRSEYGARQVDHDHYGAPWIPVCQRGERPGTAPGHPSVLPTDASTLSIGCHRHHPCRASGTATAGTCQKHRLSVDTAGRVRAGVRVFGVSNQRLVDTARAVTRGERFAA